MTCTRWAMAMAGAAAMCAHTESALAAPTARLRYTRPPNDATCPDQEGLRALTAARMGYDPFSPDATTTIVATIERTEHTLRGRVELLDDKGQRRGARQMESAGEDCGELASSMTLAIVIAIDPLRLTGSTPPSPSPSTASPSTSTPVPSTPASTSTPEPSSPPPDVKPTAHAETREPLRFRAGVGAVGSLGANPATTIGGTLLFGASRGALSLDAEARLDASASTTRPPGSGGNVSSSLLLFGLVPCAHFGRVIGCLAAGAGAIRGEGIDVGKPQSRSAFYFSFGPRLGIEQPLASWFTLRAHIDLAVAPTRVTLFVNEHDAWTTPVLAGALGVEALVLFP